MFCANELTRLEFDFGHCQQMAEEEDERDKGRLFIFKFLT